MSHLRRRAEGGAAAGPARRHVRFVVEEIWKLVGRRATGAWLVELAKRARHIGLWLIAIIQQRSDLASREGRTLLDTRRSSCSCATVRTMPPASPGAEALPGGGRADHAPRPEERSHADATS
jgi:hypothetical protein